MKALSIDAALCFLLSIPLTTQAKSKKSSPTSATVTPVADSTVAATIDAKTAKG